MEDKRKTKEQLINELTAMRQRVAELEESDIHHKRAKEALRESEEMFRLFMEHSPGASLPVRRPIPFGEVEQKIGRSVRLLFRRVVAHADP